MGTICFDIKRKDQNYVCIQHAELNKFEYDTHLAFFFWAKGDDNWYYETETERFIYLLIAKDQNYDGIERIIFACNNEKDCKEHKNRVIIEKIYPKCTDLRIVALPLWKIETKYVEVLQKPMTFASENDMQDNIVLYCPEDLNKKHHVYGSYEQKKDNTYKWIAPPYLKKD